jgi:hypothetical protein
MVRGRQDAEVFPRLRSQSLQQGFEALGELPQLLDLTPGGIRNQDIQLGIPAGKVGHFLLRSTRVILMLEDDRGSFFWTPPAGLETFFNGVGAEERGIPGSPRQHRLCWVTQKCAEQRSCI